jgi:hypothetical protein
VRRLIRWKFRREKAPRDEEAVADLFSLIASEAMMNRCALNPEAFRLYTRPSSLSVQVALWKE